LILRFYSLRLVTEVSPSVGFRRSGDPPVAYLISASADLGGSQTFSALTVLADAPRPAGPDECGCCPKKSPWVLSENPQLEQFLRFGNDPQPSFPAIKVTVTKVTARRAAQGRDGSAALSSTGGSCPGLDTVTNVGQLMEEGRRCRRGDCVGTVDCVARGARYSTGRALSMVGFSCE
jgi:hypothetical protein